MYSIFYLFIVVFKHIYLRLYFIYLCLQLFILLLNSAAFAAAE